MDYRPSVKKLERGKSPLLGPAFRLSKSAKRLIANAATSDERAMLKQLMIQAELRAMSTPSKRESAREKWQ
jgi:hypothetical protein